MGTSLAVDFGNNADDLAGDVGGMAVDDWGVAFLDGAWVIDDDYLGHELLDLFGWVDEGITSDKAPLDLVNFELDIEADIVSGVGELDLLVVHLDGLDVSFQISWGEDNVGFLPENTSLDTSDCHSSVSLDFVHIVDRNPQWFLDWSPWSLQKINSLDQEWAIIPWHIGRSSNHVLASPPRNWDKLNFLRVIPDFLQIA